MIQQVINANLFDNFMKRMYIALTMSPTCPWCSTKKAITDGWPSCLFNAQDKIQNASRRIVSVHIQRALPDYQT